MAFYLSKLLWAFVSPGSLLALSLAAGLVLRCFSCKCAKRIGTFLVIFSTLSFLAIATLPVGEWALTPLEDRFAERPLPEHVDGIIIIGGDEQPGISEARQMPIALDSMRRYLTFTELAHRYPNAKLAFSGGTARPWPGQQVIDSDIAREALAAMGAPVERMILETKSRNTWENAVYSKNIVKPLPTENWVLVTSAWHMTRAMGCFRKAGWNIYAAPTGYFTMGHFHVRFMMRFDEQLHMLTDAVHEYIGLVAYYLMGRTDALWPG